MGKPLLILVSKARLTKSAITFLMQHWLSKKKWVGKPKPLTTPVPSAKERGEAAENQALAYLKEQGLRLEARNVRYSCGELDLIMWDLSPKPATLVFVEVRARAGTTYGGAAVSINIAKQRRIIAAAAQYLQTRKASPPPCRFDVVLLQDETPPQWLQSAFTA